MARTAGRNLRKEHWMGGVLLIVDVQLGFLNEYTSYIPKRILKLITQNDFSPILFTRFVNSEDGPYPRFLGWDACRHEPETLLAPELRPYASPALTFSKPGDAGIPDELAEFLQNEQIEQVTIAGIDTDMCVLKVAMDIFDLGIKPLILTDCCASTHGLQSHLAGLAVLARNVGADQMRDAGLNGGTLAAPSDD
jgi:nicotinamidase-related amidase